jgi:proline iminopeptidase
MPREAFVHTDSAQLYYRDIGEGRPILVIHGGPDFDHTYLLPEMDLLARSFRLIYYDQRGRGRSARGVRPQDVTLRSEMEDMEVLRRHLQLDSVAVLGHSWGGVLAMEYATRHADRVSHLIMMNTAPGSHEDALSFRQHLRRIRAPADIKRMRAIETTAAYRAGDLDAETAYYRLHFTPAVRRREHLEQILGRLRSNFTPAGVRLARDIEERLYDETWSLTEYDLMPRLRQLDMPTLVLHGEDDFVPPALAAHVAESIPGAVLSVLSGCGHFCYLEAPERVNKNIAELMHD